MCVCVCMCVSSVHPSFYQSGCYMWDISKQTIYPLNSVVLLSWVLTWKARKICYRKFSSDIFISKSIASICKTLFLFLWESSGGSEAEVIEIVSLGRQSQEGMRMEKRNTLWIQELRCICPPPMKQSRRLFFPCQVFFKRQSS